MEQEQDREQGEDQNKITKHPGFKALETRFNSCTTPLPSPIIHPSTPAAPTTCEAPTSTTTTTTCDEHDQAPSPATNSTSCDDEKEANNESSSSQTPLDTASPEEYCEIPSPNCKSPRWSPGRGTITGDNEDNEDSGIPSIYCKIPSPRWSPGRGTITGDNEDSRDSSVATTIILSENAGSPESPDSPLSTLARVATRTTLDSPELSTPTKICQDSPESPSESPEPELLELLTPSKIKTEPVTPTDTPLKDEPKQGN